jgi:hypothetical protein
LHAAGRSNNDTTSTDVLPMITRTARFTVCALLAVCLAWLASRPAPVRAADVDEPTVAALSGTYRYTLAGRVRLLLFWVGRDDVGVGRFARHEHPDGRTVELMVGMEPEKAPRRANRWGYSREELRGGDTEVVVAGTDYEAESLEDIQQHLEREVAIAVGVLRARITPDAAVVRTTALEADQETTWRDIDTILSRATDAEDDRPWRTRRIERPDGVRPGFLLTLAEWIDRTVAAHQENPGTAPPREGSIPYVYSARIYDMSVRRLTFEDEIRFRGRTYRNVLSGEFESRNRETGERSRFAVAYGTEGDLTGVPVRIVLRPRWWLEAELLLDR